MVFFHERLKYIMMGKAYQPPPNINVKHLLAASTLNTLNISVPRSLAVGGRGPEPTGSESTAVHPSLSIAQEQAQNNAVSRKSQDKTTLADPPLPVGQQISVSAKCGPQVHIKDRNGMVAPIHHPVDFGSHATDVSSGNPTVKVGVNFVQDVQDVLKTSVTREAIRDDLKKLSDDLIAIEKGFSDVTGVTIRLDNWDILPCKFTSDWEQLHNDYTSLMHASRGIAADLSNELESFLTVNVKILKNQKFSEERKKRNLNKYIKKLDSFMSKAQANDLQFEDIRNRVLRFREAVRTEVKSAQLKDKQLEFEQDLEQLDKKIVELQLALQGSSRMLKESWGLFVEHIPKIGGTAVTGSLVNIAPTVGKTIMDTVLSKFQPDLADAVEKQRKGLEGEANKELQFKLEALREEIKSMRKEFAEVVLDVSNLDAMLTDLDRKLGGIQEIWRLLKEDARRLLHQLNDANDADDELEFNLFLESMEGVYENLKIALDAFCLSVRR